MKVLIVLGHSGFYRHFDTVVPALCAAGHEVKVITRGRAKRDVDEDYVEALLAGAAKHPGGSYEFSLRKPTGLITRRVRRARGAMDYGIYFRIQHNSPQMAPRMVRLCPRPLRPLFATAAGRRLVSSDSFLALHRRFQALLPSDRALLAQLRREQPDVVVACPYLYRFSNDGEYIRAAHHLGIPTVGAVASWDNLSTKGTFPLLPDTVLVWNTGLAKEAQLIHGIPRDRLRATGAAKFDPYFELEPSENREQFCARIGIDPARPYMLYIGSSEQVAGDETGFVSELWQALKDDPRTERLQVVVRPHPLNGKVWEAFEHEEIVVFPRGGQRPDIAGPRDEYFNTLSYATAVVGVNTSAFLEAAIADRPCLSIVSDRHREGQVERGHFQHLLKGQFIETVPDYAGAVNALGEVLDGRDARRGLRRRFVESFVRPWGIQRRAGEVVAEAIVGTARNGKRGPEPIMPAARSTVPKPALPAGKVRRPPTEEEERAALLRLHDEHPIPVRQPLALVCQLGGRGGDLLNRLLDGHPQLHVHPHQLRLGGRDGWPVFDLDAGPQQWWESLAEPLPWAAGGNGRGGDGDGQPPFLLVPTLQRRLFEHCVAQWSPSTRREVLDCYMTSYFNAWLDYQGLYGQDRRWVSAFAGATGIAAEDRDAFFADYPDGRLVAVVGDPHGDEWAAGAQALLGAQREAAQPLLTVPERQLADDPEAAMRRVAEFLELEWDPVLARPTLNRMPAGVETDAAEADGAPAGARADELYQQLVAAAR